MGCGCRDQGPTGTARLAGERSLSLEAEAFCREAAAPAGSDFYYAILFHPPEEQRALAALFALRREILEVAEESAEPAVRSMRQAWWQQELMRAAAGTAQHPVAQELQRLAAEGRLDPAPLMEYVDRAVPQGLWLDAGSDHWLPHLGAIHAPHWEAAAGVCRNGAAQRAAVAQSGTLVEAAYQLRGIGAALRTGAGTLPRDLAGAGQERINTDALTALAAQLAEQLEQAWPRLASAGAPLFCPVMMRLSAVLLREIERDVTPVLTGRVALTPLHKLWLAWRVKAAHRASKKGSE